MFVTLFEASASESGAALAGPLDASIRPKLLANPGFIEVRDYVNLSQPGWGMTVPVFRDERSLVAWRTDAGHVAAQQRGRTDIMTDYHLRVGQLVAAAGKGWDDAQQAALNAEAERLDETVVGEGKYVVIVDGLKLEGEGRDLAAIADMVSLGGGSQDSSRPAGLVSFAIFETDAMEGDILVLTAWKDVASGQAYQEVVGRKKELRFRGVRILRDYAKFDRREAPTWFKDEPGRETIH